MADAVDIAPVPVAYAVPAGFGPAAFVPATSPVAEASLGDAAPASGAPVLPAPASPVLAGFGPTGRAAAIPATPAGFGSARLVSPYDLAARYRRAASQCDFDASDRATLYLARAKDLEQSPELFVVDEQIG